MQKFDQIVETLKVRAFGFAKIPLIWFVNPTVIAVGEDRTEVVIKLNRRTQNHLKSMYFGTLAIGADLAGGILFMKLMKDKKLKASFVFKDMDAKFLKRADGDVHFVCDTGQAVSKLVDDVIASPERQETVVEIKALVPTKYKDDPVAIFRLTLSVKR
ncbi:MAG: DUF4442 domain-containing protein, partial [Proteobacteria bacterium]|nr:DUF4442 domain-containing protein [Pseudomonadota bacterium]